MESKERAVTLLHMKANKKLIQEEMSKETGKAVLLKDISNIAAAAKHGKSRNDLDITVQTLKDKYGCVMIHFLRLFVYRCRCRTIF